MFQIVLVQPEIPPNTGNIIRLAANTGCRLHLVEPLGFSMQDKQMRRAGLDYHEYASVKRHASWQAFVKTEQPSVSRSFALSTHGKSAVFGAAFQAGDWLVFGAETSGLAPDGCRRRAELLRLASGPGQRAKPRWQPSAVASAWRQTSRRSAAAVRSSPI